MPKPPKLAVLREKLAQKRPLKRVSTGNSTTQGAKLAGRERFYPSIIEGRVRWVWKRSRDFVINFGIFGQRTAGLQADFDWRVLQFKPDIVPIIIGMNNAGAGQTDESRSQPTCTK